MVDMPEALTVYAGILSQLLVFGVLLHLLDTRGLLPGDFHSVTTNRKRDDASLNDEIAKLYYRTTSSRGHHRTREHYQVAAALLMWRLGPWVPPVKDARCLDLACGCG